MHPDPDVAAVAVGAASAAAGPDAADAARVAGLAGEIGRWIAADPAVRAARAAAARAHARNLAAAGVTASAGAFIAGAADIAAVFTDRDIAGAAAAPAAAASWEPPPPPGEHPGTAGFTVPGRLLLLLRMLLLAATGYGPAGAPADMPALIARTREYAAAVRPPAGGAEIAAALAWIMEPGWSPPGTRPAPGTPGNTPCPLCGRDRVPIGDALFDVTGGLAGIIPVRPAILASAVTRDQAAQILAGHPGATCSVHCLGDAGESARRHGWGAAVPCADDRCAACRPRTAQWFAPGLPRYADPELPATQAPAAAGEPAPARPAAAAGRCPGGNAGGVPA